MQRQDLNWWQAHWVQYLSKFNVVWCYKPRPSMEKPNALSRREDHTEGIEDNNKEVIVITPDKIRMTILIMDEGDSLEKKIFNATCLLSEADIQRLCKKNAICEECNGMLYDNLGRLYVPKSNLLWMEVIQKYHNFPIAGHPSYKKVLDLLQCNYSITGPGWPQQSKNMLLDVTHARDSRNLMWPQQAFFTHLKLHHYCGNTSQLISSQTSPSSIALMQSWQLLISSQKKLNLSLVQKPVWPWIWPSYSCTTCRSIMDSHVPLLQTEACNWLHKSYRKLTRPSAFPLSYPYLSTLRWMVRQKLLIKKFRSSYGSTASKNKVNGLIGLSLPSSQWTAKHTHQSRLHPSKQHSLMCFTWELNPSLQIRHQLPRISHPKWKVCWKVWEKI